MEGLTYILTFVEGILTFISPCILPLIPVYLFYLAGLSGAEDRLNSGLDSRTDRGIDNGAKSRLMINSIGFVVGFTIVFVILGAAATSIGQFLKGHLGTLKKISSIIMIILGMNFLGIFTLGFLDKVKRIDYKFKKLDFANSIVFGIVFSFAWTPCVGPLLFAALSTASIQETVLQGVILLFLYSLGLGVPFIITALIFEKIKGALRNIQKYNRIISIASGILLIVVGIIGLL